MTHPRPTPSETVLAGWEGRVAGTLRAMGLRSVRATIFAFAVLATLIPALATAWISYRQNRRAITEKLSQELQAKSGQAAREMDLWLKERVYDLRVFASSYEVSENITRAGTGAPRQTLVRLTDYLGSVRERFEDYDELLVVDPNARVVASSAPSAGALHLPDGWLAHARAGDAELGEPYAEGNDGTHMTIAVPIVGTTGQFLGGLAARVNFRGVTTQLRAFLRSEEDRIAVVDREGEILLAVAAGDSDGSTFSLPPSALAALRDGEGTIVRYDDWSGAPTVGTLATIPRTNWAVTASVPARRAFAEIAHLRNATALLVLALLLVVGSLAYGLGFLIVGPLHRLTRAAGRVAAGDLDVAVPVAGGGEIAYLTSVFNEMVERLQQGRAKLEHLSTTDALTGLVNRRRLMTDLEREVRRSERHERCFCLLMLDVDRFKRFNDTHGHLAGDEVLKGIAARLQGAARQMDTVARFGGEEFVVMLPETSAEEAATAAERIRASVAAEPFPDGNGGTEEVTVSIGIAEFPTSANTLETLIAAADAALYRAKRGGRNRVASPRKTKGR